LVAVLNLPEEVTSLVPELGVIPGLFTSFFDSIKDLAPSTTVMPPPDILKILCGAEAATAFFVIIGVAPALFNTIAFLQYVAPIFLLAGDDFQFAALGNIKQMYFFMLALHFACGSILLLDAFAPDARSLKRIAAMQPFLFVAVIKYR
jgi:hypothetical protein